MLVPLMGTGVHDIPLGQVLFGPTTKRQEERMERGVLLLRVGS